MEVGETRTWQVVAFTDEAPTTMTLSWTSTIRNIPDDVMLYFRRMDKRGNEYPPLHPSQKGMGERAGEGASSSTPITEGNAFGYSELDWRDMRQAQSIDLVSTGRITEIPIEIRAERFAMAPPVDVAAIPGEGQVEIRWKAEDNPFIDGYTVIRQAIGEPSRFTFHVSRPPFIDADVEEEVAYAYQLIVRFKSGAELRSELMTVTVLPVIEATVLRQNYPNPFNPETWIPYELAKDASVSLEIYNPKGQLVRHLELGFQERGRYTSRQKAAYWDGRNDLGEQAASGVYFYVLRAGDYTDTRKMVILK
jgi:hypothetical protein